MKSYLKWGRFKLWKAKNNMNKNPYSKFIGSSKRPNKRGNPYYNVTQNALLNNSNKANKAIDPFNSSDFIKGALIGAAAAYLLTNKKVQESLFKTVAKGSSMFQMGMEELKERYEDAQAEIDAAND